MFKYLIGQSLERVTITQQVMNHFAKYQQNQFWKREAGGQLFMQIKSEYDLVITKATGPRLTDKRSRYSYIPDRKAEQAEIDDLRKEGLHYIGDWHTHPEDNPSPSGDDEESIRKCFLKSTHDLRAFLLVIVGRKSLPDSLYVAVHDGSKFYEIKLWDPTAAVGGPNHGTPSL